MQVNTLPTEGQAKLNATHEVVITHEDLTAASTTQTLTVNIPAGSWVKSGCHILAEQFVSPSSTSLTYTAGDDSDSDLFMTATQIDAAHASTIDYKAPTPGSGAAAVGTGKIYTTADTVDIALTGSHNLNTFTAGKLRLFMSIIDLDTVS
jgi:hypothetical protein